MILLVSFFHSFILHLLHMGYFLLDLLYLLLLILLFLFYSQILLFQIFLLIKEMGYYKTKDLNWDFFLVSFLFNLPIKIDFSSRNFCSFGLLMSKTPNCEEISRSNKHKKSYNLALLLSDNLFMAIKQYYLNKTLKCLT